MKNLGVIAMMLTVEFLEVGVNTISKAAMEKGMNDFVFVMYSNAFAVIFLLPFCFIFYRYFIMKHPLILTQKQVYFHGLLQFLHFFPLCLPFAGDELFHHSHGVSLANYVFLASSDMNMVVLGCTFSCSVQMLRFFGIGYGSPTLASAMSDLIPAFTFILAIFCRMEKLEGKADSTLAKLFGTIVSIAGALTITLCKGLPHINPHSPFKSHSLTEVLPSSQFNWIFGALLLMAQSFLQAVVFIVQTRTIKEYPEELIVVTLRSLIVAILSAPASLISGNGPKALRLEFNIDLIAILCSAIFVDAIRNVVHMWAIGKKGPLYVAMFKPIEMVIAVVMGITFLGDTLYLGRVVGAAIIVVGFYGVIWGKSQEEMVETAKDCKIHDCSPEVPLLTNKAMEP